MGMGTFLPHIFFLISLIASLAQAVEVVPIKLREKQAKDIHTLKAFYIEECRKLDAEKIAIEKWYETESSIALSEKEEEKIRNAAKRYLLEERDKRLSFLKVAYETLITTVNEGFNRIQKWLPQTIDKIASLSDRSSYELSYYLSEKVYYDDAYFSKWSNERARKAGFVPPKTLNSPPKTYTIDQFTKYKDYKISYLLKSPLIPNTKDVYERFWKMVFSGKPDAAFRVENNTLYFNNNPLQWVFYVENEGKTVETQDKELVGHFRKLIFEACDEILYTAPLRKQMVEYLGKLAAAPEYEPKLFSIKPFTPALYRPEPITPLKEVRLLDAFGREVEQVILTDWDGYLANPALKFSVELPSSVNGRGTVRISSRNPRIYFNLPSSLTKDGPYKNFSYDYDSKKFSFLISIWPSRKNQPTNAELTISYWETDSQKDSVPANAKQKTLPILVIDNDSPDTFTGHNTIVSKSTFPYLEAPLGKPYLTLPWPYMDEKKSELPENSNFSINLDFSHDRSGFFTETGEAGDARRAIFQQAADDWSYFIKKTNYDRVEVGKETTVLRTNGVDNETIEVKNEQSFRDFLLYVTGSDKSDTQNAFGRASSSTNQTSYGSSLKLRRSGQVLIEGVYKGDGFTVNNIDDDWWKALYKTNFPIDLYSFALHEMGHALFANKAYPIFEGWIKQESVSDIRIQDYQQNLPKLDKDTNHFPEVFDAASKRGAYGYSEEKGLMPHRRWLLTKFDLMMLQAVGYQLRNLDFLQPLEWKDGSLYSGIKNRIYSSRLVARGGIEPYYWNIQAGELPKGLQLNSWTGEISGTPKVSGLFHILINVRDNTLESDPGIYKIVELKVDENF